VGRTGYEIVVSTTVDGASTRVGGISITRIVISSSSYLFLIISKYFLASRRARR
jgi:hypothetical protein